MKNKEEIKRIDGKYFLVRELETNGEPINVDGEKLQPINSIDDYDCQHCCLHDTYNCGEPCVGGFLVRVLPENSKEKDAEKPSNVEITGKNLKHDNKENMEEKKLNFKPFDLEAAKAGKPVCTKDGRKARIICFDAKCNLPIIALITQSGGDESLARYNSNGRFTNLNESDCDLMMLLEKKEGWVNVYKMENEYICENECSVSTGIAVYKSESEAKRNIDKNEIYVNTIKITWEE